VILANAADPAEILAVGAHEFDDQRTEDGQDIEGSYLILGAVRVDLQGALVDMKTFADQRPVTLGRLLMETMVDDLPDRPGIVRAIVTRISLDPVTRLARGRTRCADHHLHASRPPGPRELEPCRPGLIDRAHWPRKRPKPLDRRR
jgi:hypothetical protein